MNSLTGAHELLFEQTRASTVFSEQEVETTHPWYRTDPYDPFEDSGIRQWKRVQNPPTDEWPVFPTGHGPSKYAAVRDARDDADALLGDATVDEVLRELEISPPAITTHGARRVLARIAEEAGVDVDGEAPKLHGARRGLGDALFREDRGLASDILRHSSLSVTKEAYSHIDASERGETASRLLDE